MSSNTRIKTLHGISTPRGTIAPGTIVDLATFEETYGTPTTEAEVRSWIQDGFAEVYDESAPVETPKPQKGGKPVGRWIKDPDGLKGMGLEELNALVADVDPTVAAFETVEEAIAQLSSEYVKP